ncbi:hypothetical protein [Candidatus Burkholderia verschuerenii]|uniref:hypothetical protein n=1 Tax=Candidatus Burkholderia verschuerenii TaxID=242163 RepID=UPI000B1B3BE9|nr:hypothetical protein [Candidatus Burkholderia verschuerenii]
MIRLFYIAVAALLVSVCVESALAQSVLLTPAIDDSADSASTPRFQNQVSANFNRAAKPSVAEQELKRERCALLKQSLDWAKDHPFDSPRVTSTGNGVSSTPQNELERQASMLDCPKDSQNTQ